MNSLTKLVCTVLTLVVFTSSASAVTLLFDFGRADLQSDPGTDPGGKSWNNILRTTSEIFVLVDDTGAVYGTAGFEITDDFFITGVPSQLGTEAPSGDAAAYPVSATDDYLFGHVSAFAGQPENPLGQFKLNNLDSNNLYDFTFFASRTNVTDSRDAQYDVTGANSGSGVLEAANNDSSVLSINNISPDGNNEITIDVTSGPNNSSGAGFYYLGLLQVDVRVIPEPSSMALLAGSLLASSLFRRRNR